MIFKAPVYFSLAVLLGFGSVILYSNIHIKPSDVVLYKQIVQERKDLHSSDVLERHPSVQLRKNTQKDIWTSRGSERTHFQMHSDLSQLALSQKKDHYQAKEDLEEITCTNKLGKMIAKTGSFEYPANQIIANDLKCEHQLGTIYAQNAVIDENEVLTLSDNVILSATDFILHSQKAKCLIDSSPISQQQIEFKEDVNIFLSDGIIATGDVAIYKTGFLTLFPAHIVQEDQYFIDGDDCLITLTDEKPEKIEMTKNIFFSSKIQGKDTFALADSVTFYPDEEKLILTAQASKRVLIWQEGMRLSAPEIHIQKECIQGKGDVRFSFNAGEQNLIDQFISKYL